MSYDPVCGMRATSDLFKADYQGKGYNFCSDHCKSQFEANPANFA
ncbi:YHS domain-containing protein [bacterium]|nr:MAG: YHS domain-containing protein [bacterium]